jgi:hypothetical protein
VRGRLGLNYFVQFRSIYTHHTPRKERENLAGYLK